MTDLLTDEDFFTDGKDDDLLREGEEFVFKSETGNSHSTDVPLSDNDNGENIQNHLDKNKKSDQNLVQLSSLLEVSVDVGINKATAAMLMM